MKRKIVGASIGVAIICIAILAAIFVPSLFSPELQLIFTSLFIVSVELFILCCILVAHLFASRRASHGAHFFFGLLLIVSAAVMFSGFEQIAANVGQWAPSMERDHPTMFVILPQLLGYTKSVIAFGFAAIGANVAANAIAGRSKRECK